MLLLFFFNGNTSVFYFSALGVGFAYAGILVIFPGLTSQNFGMRNQGLNYGFMYFGFAVGAVIAPYVTSAIAKYTGSYNTVFIFDHGAIAYWSRVDPDNEKICRNGFSQNSLIR
ncbi:permease [Salmonella enterica subsp. enterica]|uniref:Permease n=1 Tax=Salmonella enterica I TaxID=59201 RepID=A0A379VLI0_SALET|nr:permease [Salmonella enterica subsp. enterica]